MRSFIRKAALIAGALASFTLATPASACPVPTPTPQPETVSYIVTNDERTSRALGIKLQDNLDYELDHPEYCETLAQVDKTVTYIWTECYGVPVNEQPRSPEYS